MVYVDDILVISANKSTIGTVENILHVILRIKDLGEARYFLGMEITRDAQGIQLTQRKYAIDVLKETGFLLCKPATTPMKLH